MQNNLKVPIIVISRRRTLRIYSYLFLIYIIFRWCVQPHRTINIHIGPLSDTLYIIPSNGCLTCNEKEKITSLNHTSLLLSPPQYNPTRKNKKWRKNILMWLGYAWSLGGMINPSVFNLWNHLRVYITLLHNYNTFI